MTGARTDIIDRLREVASYLDMADTCAACLLAEAAVEIERLRALDDEARKAEWKIGYDQGYADAYRAYRS